MVEVLRNGGQPAPSVLGLVDACDFDYNTACWREAEPGFFFCPWTEADPCCADAADRKRCAGSLDERALSFGFDRQGPGWVLPCHVFGWGDWGLESAGDCWPVPPGWSSSERCAEWRIVPGNAARHDAC